MTSLAPLWAEGEVPAVPNAFPRSTTYNPGQLLYRSPTGQGRITNIIYHNGSVYTNVVTGSDRKVWKWSDPNNAGSMGITSSTDIPLYNDLGNHGHYKVGDYFGGAYDLAIKRQSLGVNTYGQSPDWNAAGSNLAQEGTKVYWPWSTPFHWLQYAGVNGNYPAFLYRGGQKLYEWDALGEDGVIGTSILLGNLLFLISDETSMGILCYDISPIFKTPAERPILLDKLTGNFGAYTAVVWENYLVLSRGDPNRVEIIDYSDPTDLKHITTIDTKGTPAKFGDGSAWYVQAQDNFIFTQHQKIDMDTFKVVLELDQIGNSRPAGSASGRIDTSNYLLPLGNLLVTGGYSFEGQDCLGVWAHQAAPDTKKPYVGYHVPRPGQTNFPLGAPISLIIHESLESYTIINGETLILREVGTTTPIDCWTSFSHDDILTVTPKQYLQANKTYEVVVVANGIKDPVGNGIEPYTFTFSTGSSVTGGNAAPVIGSFSAGPSPAAVNTTVNFTASATDAENNLVEYRFNFGDGSPSTNWGTSTTVSHSYIASGHFDAKLQVRDTKPDGSKAVVSKSFTVTIANTIAGPSPTHSSTIALDRTNRRVWIANSDADTVSILNADTNAKISEFNLNTLLGITGSIDPRGIALDSIGNAWVACHDADRVIVINSGGGLVRSISPGYGSTPIGVAITPDGTSAFVTLMGKGTLKRYNTSSAAETGTIDLGPTPRAIAITGDGSRVLVTRFLADLNHGMVWDVANTTTLSLNRTYRLIRDRSTDGSSNGRGIPNHLTGITISPDGAYAWITGTKHNDQHGTFFTGVMSTDNTARALLVRLRLNENEERGDFVDRIDVDNSDSPTAVVFSPRGDWAFTTLQGNNEVGVFDDIAIRAGAGKATKWRFGSDLAPQGLVFDPNTNKLFVSNFMARNVSVHDLSGFFASGSRAMNAPKVNAVTTEKLSPGVLAGKQIFYNASRKNATNEFTMSRDSYVSCATCHLDGGQDGRVWDFTQRGEGLRNSIDLRGKSGLGHGNLHWTANFDEVQDFENDIRNHFGGAGLVNATTVSGPLGASKAGISTELDQLSAYVTSLNGSHIPNSPQRAADGSMTTAAVAGLAVFQAQNCASCHSGGQFTDSTGGIGVAATLHDVGTLRTSSGKRIGATLAGIDTPSLLGVHASKPYFHDGSAPTLDSVFAVAGGRTYQAEDAALIGGASKANFIPQNYSNSVHLNGLIEWSGNGTATFSGLDGGGTSGIGAVELRYATNSVQTITVTINGTSRSFVTVNGLNNPGWSPSPNWQMGRLEGVNLNAGTGNAIAVTSNGDFNLDDITVSTAADLAKAQPHRRVLGISPTDRDNLITYLQQLDAKSAPPDPNINLRNPENPANAVAGVNFDFHQFSAGLSDTSGLTPANKVSSGVWSGTLTAVPGQDADSDDANYGLVYAGYINVPTDGTYTFYTNSDDGNKLQIGSVTVASDESPHGARWNTDSVSIGLRAGRHAFTLKFYENGGGDSLLVEYAGPGIPRAQLPASALYRVGTVVSTVATPAFSPSGGAYSSALSVTIATATSGATIRFTMNGSDPTGASQAYAGAINVSASTTLKARAFQTGWNDSAIATADYTITAGPAGYTFAVNEGGSYTFTQPVDVAYGANGSFYYRYGVTGAFVFDNATFGDPIPGVTKSGYFKVAAGSTGTISFDKWTGLASSNAVSSIPVTAPPNESGTLTTFEVPSDIADLYGIRVRGYITPATSGNYTFWIAGDDNVELWLSTDGNASNKVRIAYHTAWTPSRVWDGHATQKSTAIALTAGSRYYVEALMREGNGGDNLAVAWKLNDSTNPVNGSAASIVPGSVLSPYVAGIESGAIYEIEPRNAVGKRLNVEASGAASGTNVEIRSDVNANNQRWKLEDQGAGIYELTPQHATSNRLDVNGSGSADGTKVQIWVDNDTNAQRWKFELQADGNYEIIPQHDVTKRLKVNGGGTTDGTAVQSWADDNSDAVRWNLLKQ